MTCAVLTANEQVGADAGTPRGSLMAAALSGTIAILGGTVAILAISMGSSQPAMAQNCAESGWQNGMPVFQTDCRARVRRRASLRQRQYGKSAKPPNDLRKGSVPFKSHIMLEAIEAAIERYGAVVRHGGWPIIGKGRYFRPGVRDDRVPRLRRRLIITGDLSARAGTKSREYSDSVVAAVKRFQSRHGLRPSGVIGNRTLAHLNVTATERLKQLRINARRVADLLAQSRDERYVLVNISAFQLEAVENGEVVQRHRVIVGKPDRQTPSLKAKIRGLNFFPYWRVPDSIAHRDLIPRLRKQPSYLDKEYIRVLDGFGGNIVDPRTVDWDAPESKKLKFRQDPGPHNALGLVRIDMPNEHIVYLHDTPMKSLFNRHGRSYSAGCVRVQNVFSLARWIAASEPGWDRRRIDDILSAGVAEDLKLSKSLPVYFAYITAWVDPNGPVQFRHDLYDRDGESNGSGAAAEIEGPPLPNLLSP